jgi:hypothetical protein
MWKSMKIIGKRGIVGEWVCRGEFVLGSGVMWVIEQGSALTVFVGSSTGRHDYAFYAVLGGFTVPE